MGVIICGIPKRADGKFYCPYCNYSSYEIEDFATSMCWDCALTDEEETSMTTIKDISIGDEVTLTTTFKVSQVDNREGALYGEGLKGRKFPVDNDGTLWYNGGDRHIFTISGHKKAVKKIEHMPPQQGDVWADSLGNEYFVLRGMYGKPKVVDLYGNDVRCDLKDVTGIHLVHRKGNKSV